MGHFAKLDTRTMRNASVSAASAAAAVGKVRAKLRAMSQSPLSERQAVSLKETQVPDAVWVSHATFPAPKEDRLRQAIIAVSKCLGTGEEEFDSPEIVCVKGEWTGQRSVSERETSKSQISERDYESNDNPLHSWGSLLVGPSPVLSSQAIPCGC